MVSAVVWVKVYPERVDVEVSKQALMEWIWGAESAVASEGETATIPLTAQE
jgi:hypothetical protein